jgi:hypothetical protein
MALQGRDMVYTTPSHGATYHRTTPRYQGTQHMEPTMAWLTCYQGGRRAQWGGQRRKNGTYNAPYGSLVHILLAWASGLESLKKIFRT